eukprot:TRINITY_DN59285_c0_g2_i2.p1 TRINITY_DN59285_c0_g2~~TRINITY_DN59285_c0_g2_i2.p1  ORF type:complete len:392 (+),score=81.04 TRINITY_DN59285_c0_g2_i2:77-1252(+)
MALKFEIFQGTSRVVAALSAVGSPQLELAGRVLHVTGTNGKGSVCAMAFAALKQAGLRVGCFNSPYLVEPADMIRLAENGADVAFTDEEFSKLQKEVLDAFWKENQGADIPIFELQVVAVFLLFARKQLDVAIFEVGIGGRNCATNVMERPAACAVTSIALDHQEFLGPTREDIAEHKSGIFRKDRPAFVSVWNLESGARSTLAACAEKIGCPIHWIEPAACLESSRSGQRMQVPALASEVLVPFNGEFQCSNAAMAVALLLELRSQDIALRSRSGVLDHSVLSDSVLTAGIAKATWPGRLQWCSFKDFGPALVDGAHNLEAAECLAKYVNTDVRKEGKPLAWIVGMSAGKDAQGTLSELLKDSKDAVIAVSFNKVEGMPWIHPQDPIVLR